MAIHLLFEVLSDFPLRPIHHSRSLLHLGTPRLELPRFAKLVVQLNDAMPPPLVLRADGGSGRVGLGGMTGG